MPDAASPTTVPRPNPLVVFGVLALALALRLLHLSSAIQSPLSYQPGPDEDYYRSFGDAVAHGRGADGAEFTFMDPGYGYLLGAFFRVAGLNVFAVYLLQGLVDTATVYGIFLAGRLLGRPRAGLLGALLYALTSTAIMFCAALLKEIWVAAFVTWWVVGALVLIRSDRRWAWFCFGAYCGAGVALRSTLLLLGLLALILPWFSRTGAMPMHGRLSLSALLGAGLITAMMPWSVRNFHAIGNWSPLPHNGGIVLHQIYNAQNPESVIWIPPFVNYSQPGEIWRGYAAEAQRRAGHPLSAPEADRYWKAEAFAFMRDQPARVAVDVARKGLVFLADTEVPNNRSSAEERLFSPLLRLLPPPMAWLLGMGLAGCVWFALQDRRWPIVAAPIAMSWLTFALFWAEDRFRFHAAPALALCGGIWADGMVVGAANLRRRLTAGRGAWAACGLLAVGVFTASMLLGAAFPAPAPRWDRVIWGYIKMGRNAEAAALAERVVREQPDNGPVVEALGYLAAAERRYDEAAVSFRRAVELRPRSYFAHYNLAKAYLALGRGGEALQEAKIARDLGPSGDAEALVAEAGTKAPALP